MDTDVKVGLVVSGGQWWLGEVSGGQWRLMVSGQMVGGQWRSVHVFNGSGVVGCYLQSVMVSGG